MLSRIIPQNEELVALGMMSIRTKSTDKRNRKCQRKKPSITERSEMDNWKEPKYRWK